MVRAEEGNGDRILAAAVSSGSEETFGKVLGCVREMLTEAQARDVWNAFCRWPMPATCLTFCASV